MIILLTPALQHAVKNYNIEGLYIFVQIFFFKIDIFKYPIKTL